MTASEGPIASAQLAPCASSIQWPLGIGHWSFSLPPHIGRYRFAAPGDVQAAFALFIGLGWVEVVPFVWQIVLFEVSLHLGISPLENRTNLESIEIGIV